jgi:hypothetical protein
MIPKNKIPFILRHVQLTSNYSLFLSLDVHHEIREVSFKQLAETECGKPYDLVSSAFEVNSLYPALLRWDMLGSRSAGKFWFRWLYLFHQNENSNFVFHFGVTKNTKSNKPLFQVLRK